MAMRAAGLPAGGADRGFPRIPPPQPQPQPQPQPVPAPPVAPLRQQQLMQMEQQRQAALMRPPAAERRQLDPLELAESSTQRGNDTAGTLQVMRAAAKSQADIIGGLETRVARMEAVIRGLASELNKANGVRSEMESTITRLMSAKQNADGRQAALAGELLALSRELQAARTEASTSDRELRVAVSRVEGKLGAEAKLVEQLREADAETVNSAAKQFVSLRAALNDMQVERRRDQEAVATALSRMDERARFVEAKAVQQAASVAETRIGALAKTITHMEERQVAREVSLAERLRDEVGVFRKHEASDKKVAVERLIVMEGAIKEEHENRMKSQTTLKRGIEAVAAQCSDSVNKLRAENEARNRKLASQMKHSLEKMHGLMRDAEVGLRQDRKALESVLKMEISARLKAVDEVRDELVMSSQRTQSFCAGQVKQVAASSSLLAEKVKLLLAAQRKLFHRQATTDHNIAAVRDDIAGMVVDSVIDKEVANAVDVHVDDSLRSLGDGLDTSMKTIAEARSHLQSEVSALDKEATAMREQLDAEEEERKQAHSVVLGVMESMDVRLMTAVQQESADRAAAIGAESDARKKEVTGVRQNIHDEGVERERAFDALTSRVRAESDCRARAVQTIAEDINALNLKVDNAAADSTLFEELLRTEIDAVAKSGATALTLAEARMTTRARDLSADVREAVERAKLETDSRIRSAIDAEIESRRNAIASVRTQVEGIRTMAGEAMKVADIAADATLQAKEEREAIEAELHVLEDSVAKSVAELRGSIARNLIQGTRADDNIKRDAKKSIDAVELKMVDGFMRAADDLEDAATSAKLDTEILRTEVLDTLDNSIGDTEAAITQQVDGLRRTLTSKLDESVAIGEAGRASIERAMNEKVAQVESKTSLDRREMHDKIDRAVELIDDEIEDLHVSSKLDVEVVRTEVLDKLDGAMSDSAAALDTRVGELRTSVRSSIERLGEKVEASHAANVATCAAIGDKVDRSTSELGETFTSKLDAAVAAAKAELESSEAHQKAETAALRGDVERRLDQSSAESIRQRQRIEQKMAGDLQRLGDNFEEATVSSKLDLELLRTELESGIDAASAEATAASARSVDALRSDVASRLDATDARAAAMMRENEARNGDVVQEMTAGMDALRVSLTSTLSTTRAGLESQIASSSSALRGEIVANAEETAQRHAQVDDDLQREAAKVREEIADVCAKLEETAAREGDRVDAVVQRIDADVAAAASEAAERARVETERVDAEVQRIDAETRRVNAEVRRVDANVSSLEAETADQMRAESERVDSDVATVALEFRDKMQAEAERVDAEISRLGDAIDESIVHTKLDLELLRTDAMHAVETVGDHAATQMQAAVATVRGDIDEKLDESSVQSSSRASELDAKLREAVGQMNGELGKAQTELHERVSSEAGRIDEELRRLDAQVERVDYEVDQRILGEAQRVDAEIGRIDASLEKTDAAIGERLASEAARVDAEIGRIDASLEKTDAAIGERLASEAARVDAEIGRIDASLEKTDASIGERLASEAARVDAEIGRIDASLEKTDASIGERLASEAARVDAAFAKVATDAEETRVVEAERINAEVQRIDGGVSMLEAEVTRRIRDEAERVDAEITRVDADVEQSIVHAKVDLEVLRTDVLHAVESASERAATKIDAEVFAVRQDMSGKVKETESSAEAQQASLAARMATIEVKNAEAIDSVRSDVMGVVHERSSTLEQSLQSTESSIATEMNKLREHVTREVADTTTTLNGRISDRDEHTAHTISALRSEVTKLVDGSSADASAKHAAIEEDMRQHVSRIDMELERATRAAAEHVDGEVKRVQDQVAEAMQQETSRVNGELARIDTEVSRVEVDTRSAAEAESARVGDDVRRVESQLLEHVRSEVSRVSDESKRVDERLAGEVARIDGAIATSAAAQESANTEAITSLGAEMSSLQSRMEARLDESGALAESQAVERSAELEALEARSQKSVDSLRAEFASSLGDAEKKLTQTVEAVASDLAATLDETGVRNDARHAELETTTREAVANLEKVLEVATEGSRVALENATGALESHIRADVGAAKEELSSAIADIRERTNSTIEDSVDRIAGIEKALADDVAQVRKDVLDAVGEAKDECNANTESAKSALAADIESARSGAASELRSVEAQLAQAVEGLRADTVDNATKLKEHVENKIGRVENKADHIENKFEHVENKFERVEAKFEHVEAKFEHVETRFEEAHAKAEDLNREGLNVVLSRFDKVDAKIAEDIATLQKSVHESLDERARAATSELASSIAALREEFAEKVDGGMQNGETRHAAYLAKFEAVESKAADDLATAKTEMAKAFDANIATAVAEAKSALDGACAELSDRIDDGGAKADALHGEVETKIEEIRSSLAGSVVALDESVKSRLEAAVAQTKDELTADVSLLRGELAQVSSRDVASTGDLTSALDAAKVETAQSLQALTERTESRAASAEKTVADEIAQLREDVRAIEGTRDAGSASAAAASSVVEDVAAVKSAVDELKAELDRSVSAQQKFKTEIDATLQSTHEMIEDEASIRSVAMEELRNEEMGHYKELMDHTTSRLAEEVENIEESLNSHNDEMSGHQQNIGKLKESLSAVEKSIEAERAERTKVLAEENAERVDATQALEELIRSDANKLERELKEEISARIAAIGAQMKTEAAQQETKLSEIETKTMEDYSTLQSKIETIEDFVQSQA